MATYAEQIAQWRQQRAQQQIADRVGQIRQEYQQAQRERDTAIANNDMETAEFCDRDCVELEKEFLTYNPPRPQVDARAVEFVRRRAPFVERHGQAAYAAMDLAHRYTMQRMGLTPNTPQYFKRMDDLLSLYAKDYGLRYDPEEKMLTANEAARISGLSPQQYNQSARQISNQRRFSWQNKP
jgi:hypothetical protein